GLACLSSVNACYFCKRVILFRLTANVSGGLIRRTERHGLEDHTVRLVSMRGGAGARGRTVQGFPAASVKFSRRTPMRLCATTSIVRGVVADKGDEFALGLCMGTTP